MINIIVLAVICNFSDLSLLSDKKINNALWNTGRA